MASHIFLSHVLSTDAPGFGGAQGFFSEPRTAICQGHSSNSSEWRLSNHIGTHVDAPFHFAESGAKVDEFSAKAWIFENPFLITYKAAPAELIKPGHWTEEIPQETDLLLLKTGFEDHRGERVYWESNPGLSPELGRWLREARPKVRAIGVDILSAASFQDRPKGREAHRAFLDPTAPGQPILIIEDMALAALQSSPARVIASPLRVRAADGAPVTVIAEIK